MRYPRPFIPCLPVGPFALIACFLLPPRPLVADPIITIEEKGRPAMGAEPAPLQARRSAWIAELDRTRNRIKRRTGVDLDVELAKSLCRSGSIERCEEAVAELQSQVTTLLTTSTAPRTPPAPPEPPQSNTSVVILTQPRHPHRRDRADEPANFPSPRAPEPPSAHNPHPPSDKPIERPSSISGIGPTGLLPHD